MNINKLVSIGFTLPVATDLSAFFSNVAYISDFVADDLVDGVTIPENKVIVIDGTDANKATFKSDTQVYKDIDTILVQAGNTEPNRSRLNTVIVFQKTTETDFADAFNALMSVNANFAQFMISSRDVGEILAVAQAAVSADRLFEAQTSDTTISTNEEDNVASVLRSQNNTNIKITFHNIDAEAAAGGIMSIQASALIGAQGDVYSKITNVTPQQYGANAETNFDALNVSFYTTVNPINGGGVDQYATNI